MTELGRALDQARGAAREGRAKVVVFRSGKPDSFIAGADVDEIAAIEDPVEAEAKIKLGQAIYNDI
jgi:enoyl-CoA hydratase/carnithine racemase